MYFVSDCHSIIFKFLFYSGYFISDYHSVILFKFLFYSVYFVSDCHSIIFRFLFYSGYFISDYHSIILCFLNKLFRVFPVTIFPLYCFNFCFIQGILSLIVIPYNICLIFFLIQGISSNYHSMIFS